MRLIPSNLLLALTSTLLLSTGPLLVGCGPKPDGGTTPKEPKDEHAGHDHGPGEEHDHDHGAEEKGTPMGTITAAGTKIAIEIHGTISPGEEVHLDLKALSGPDPENVRGWIGLESGAGAMKSKAEITSGGYHLHAEAPAEITAEMKLWIEVEPAEGDREVQGVALPAH